MGEHNPFKELLEARNFYFCGQNTLYIGFIAGIKYVI